MTLNVAIYLCPQSALSIYAFTSRQKLLICYGHRVAAVHNQLEIRRGCCIGNAWIDHIHHRPFSIVESRDNDWCVLEKMMNEHRTESVYVKPLTMNSTMYATVPNQISIVHVISIDHSILFIHSSSVSLKGNGSNGRFTRIWRHIRTNEYETLSLSLSLSVENHNQGMSEQGEGERSQNCQFRCSSITFGKKNIFIFGFDNEIALW